MPIHLKTLFMIADGEHARFVRPTEEDNTLHSSSRVDPETGHKGSADHAHTQGHEKDKFAAWVAAQLNDGVAHRSYDELVLVAPTHTLAAIRKNLSKMTEAKIVGTLDKDLTKVSDHDLWPHIRAWVRPVHRAATVKS